MSTTRIFYQVLGLAVSPSPATGYMFSTGFNNVYTGANSGTNLIQQLQRMQSVTDDFAINRTNINQLGQLSILSREIIDAPTVNLGGSYYVADLSNERVLGLYVSGDQAALTNILNQTQAEKNYWIGVSPQGSDLIGYTGGNVQSFLVSNGFLGSWSTEGSVGNIPTTSFTVQGFNWATYTGSRNQPLYAVDPNTSSLVTGINFTLPTFTTGISNTVAALRPIDCLIDVANSTLGLDANDIKLQSYSISFDLNLQPLQKMGNRFPYSRAISFPVNLSTNVSAYFGDVVTGSLSTILCNDSPYTLRIKLYDPCADRTTTDPAVTYIVKGAKPDTQSFSQMDIGSIASLVSLSYTTTIGGPQDQQNNLFLSGRNI